SSAAFSTLYTRHRNGGNSHRIDASRSEFWREKSHQSRSETRPLGFCLDSAKKMVGRHVKHRTIIAPIAIGRLFARVDGAQMFALRRKDQHAARTRGEEVAI